jgi:predicted ATPase
MATDQDVSQAISSLDEKWDNPPARNALFGNVIKSIDIKNIRGLDVTLEFTWPVMAIGGINGAGKTTVIQVASSAYAKQKGGRYYKLGDWIRNALQGESPAVKDPAHVSFNFWDETNSFQVPYSAANTRWRYPRRGNPERHVEFIGIAAFAPRIERKDRTHVFRSRLQVTNSEELDPRLVESVSKILGCSYEQAKLNTVGILKGQWNETFPELKRGGYIYSEPHMGAGEQKIVRLVHTLENLPKHSLILLEEPEITLHPDAQCGLAWYLMTLSKRKGHQILVATHSTEIFETLPLRARALLIRDREGNPQVLHNVRYLTAARELSRNVRSNKDIIFVEDIVAKGLLQEIFRRHNRQLLESAEIVPIGNTDDVQRMVLLFREQSIRAIGVRDADVGDNPASGMFSLPGDRSPEELLLDEENIKQAEQFVNGLLSAFERAKARGLGFNGSKWAKKVFEALSYEAGISKELLTDRLTLTWLAQNDQKARALVCQINERLSFKDE